MRLSLLCSAGTTGYYLQFSVGYRARLIEQESELNSKERNTSRAKLSHYNLTKKMDDVREFLDNDYAGD